MANFTVGDYLVFFGTIGISFLIGVFFAIWDRKKNTPLDYFLAGRQFSTLPAALSFIVTFQSSLLILGIPAESYIYGFKTVFETFGIVTAYVFAGITVVPIFHSLKVTSVYKYFEIRYGNNVVRYLIMTGGIIYNLFYMGTVTYGTCVALEVVMGIPFWATVLLYTLITATYTSIGGIKAVIWTDVFQLIIMVTGIAAILIKTSLVSGGPTEVMRVAGDRMNLNDFRFDPAIRYQFWNTGVGSFCIFLYCTYTQAGIQRINTTPTAKSARWLYVISGPLYALFFTMTCYEGVAIFVYHAKLGCDLIASNRVKNVNEIVPVTVLQLFENTPGLAGLFIASLSSAALSTLSSCLNSLSAITYEDILKVKFPYISDKTATRVSKVIVLVYGVIAMGLTFMLSQIPGSVTVVFSTFMGSMEGPSCAIFMLSTLYRRSTTPGMVVGGLTGMAVTLWLSLGTLMSNVPVSPQARPMPYGPTDQCLPDTNTTTVISIMSSTVEIQEETELSLLQKVYQTSYIMYSFVGFFTCLVVGIIVSLLTKPPRKIDERCIFSWSMLFLNEEKDKKKEFTAEELKLMQNPYDTEIKALRYKYEMND